MSIKIFINLRLENLTTLQNFSLNLWELQLDVLLLHHSSQCCPLYFLKPSSSRHHKLTNPTESLSSSPTRTVFDSRFIYLSRIFFVCAGIFFVIGFPRTTISLWCSTEKSFTIAKLYCKFRSVECFALDAVRMFYVPRHWFFFSGFMLIHASSSRNSIQTNNENGGTTNNLRNQNFLDSSPSSMAWHGRGRWTFIAI